MTSVSATWPSRRTARQCFVDQICLACEQRPVYPAGPPLKKCGAIAASGRESAMPAARVAVSAIAAQHNLYHRDPHTRCIIQEDSFHREAADRLSPPEPPRR
jgi:hypothetical protein